ncbi:MAG: methyltransferase domain-containing protein [Candidatus Eremiobacteraeota bacterium]|nr:methyltransferase domain-containing protein [Candidatus Eremiobacteraeota bacterium]
MRDACPICGNAALDPVFERDAFPTQQHTVFTEPAAARAVMRGEIELVFCGSCDFAFNKTFELEKCPYGEQYDNSMTFSPAFSKHMDERAARVVRGRGLTDARIVEVGCGKGHFLERVMALEGDRSLGFGIDATYEGPLKSADGRIVYERRFFGGEREALVADAIVCRHVIEHVPHPLEFLRQIRAAIPAGTNTKVFFEMPALEWILENEVFWDVFYEHCNYFSGRALRRIFEAAGFEVTDISRVFDDQFFWLEGIAGTPVAPAPAASELAPAVAHFAAVDLQHRSAWREMLGGARAHDDRVALWGAGPKGVTLANLIDPDGTLLSCVVDVNPRKQGCFIPGSGQPIVAPAALGALGVKTVYLMNAVYYDEIEQMVRTLGLDVRLESKSPKLAAT